MTNTVAFNFATEFFPLQLKYLEKSQICDLLSSSLFLETKGLAVATLLLFLLKINEEMTKLFCFLP